MGRLVDADKIIELMIKDRDYAGENGFMDMFYERQHLIGIINELPTAYDVDKVVVNLEKQRDVWNDKEVADKKLVEEKRKAYNMAIKIVKGGEVK